LDKIPKNLSILIGGFVINTDTSTLPGEHWIAVYITTSNIRAFDPLGCYYPSLLVRKLSSIGKKVHYNRVMYQDPTTQMCGPICMQWLSTCV
jgi:hypothetical protein